MAGDGPTIYINGYLWEDVTNKTVPGPVYPLEQVKKIGGDPRRLNEINPAGVYRSTTSDSEPMPRL